MVYLEMNCSHLRNDSTEERSNSAFVTKILASKLPISQFSLNQSNYQLFETTPRLQVCASFGSDDCKKQVLPYLCKPGREPTLKTAASYDT